MIREEINLDWVKQLNIAIRYIEDSLDLNMEMLQILNAIYRLIRKMLSMNTGYLSETRRSNLWQDQILKLFLKMMFKQFGML